MAGTRYASRLTVFLGADGTTPAAGGFLYFYTTGTSDLEAIYLDDGLAVEAANPLVLDADGRMPTEAFLDDSVVYRVVQKTPLGATVAEDDPVAGSGVVDSIAAHNADPNAHVTATTTNRGMVSELANDAEAIAKADTSRVLTPSNLAALDASATFKGFIEIATDAEAQTGTDTARALTAANLQAVTATLTRKGVAELATSAEILTGTDADRVMSPGAFAANATLAADGFYQLPGGLELKWGTFTPAGTSSETITFSVGSGGAFPVACYHVSVSGGTSDSQDDNPVFAVPSTYAAANFGIYNDRGTTVLCSYFAIGK